MLRRCIKRSRTNSNLDPILACVLCDVSLGREQTNFHQRFYTYNSRPMFNLKPLLAVTQKHTHLVIPKKLQRALPRNTPLPRLHHREAERIAETNSC